MALEMSGKKCLLPIEMLWVSGASVTCLLGALFLHTQLTYGLLIDRLTHTIYLKLSREEWPFRLVHTLEKAIAKRCRQLRFENSTVPLIFHENAKVEEEARKIKENFRFYLVWIGLMKQKSSRKVFAFAYRFHSVCINPNA